MSGTDCKSVGLRLRRFESCTCHRSVNGYGRVWVQFQLVILLTSLAAMTAFAFGDRHSGLKWGRVDRHGPADALLDLVQLGDRRGVDEEGDGPVVRAADGAKLRAAGLIDEDGAQRRRVIGGEGGDVGPGIAVVDPSGLDPGPVDLNIAEDSGRCPTYTWRA